jgi:hypothetical protein
MNIGFPSGEQPLKALVAMVLEANMISMAYRVIPQKGHLFSVRDDQPRRQMQLDSRLSRSIRGGRLDRADQEDVAPA